MMENTALIEQEKKTEKIKPKKLWMVTMGAAIVVLILIIVGGQYIGIVIGGGDKTGGGNIFDQILNFYLLPI